MPLDSGRRWVCPAIILRAATPLCSARRGGHALVSRGPPAKQPVLQGCTIVTSTYRYKRPPRKRKAVPLEGPAIVRSGATRCAAGQCTEAGTPAHDDRKSAIVTVKRRPGRFGDVPDMTLEEHQRRGDAADALFREIVRRATE